MQKKVGNIFDLIHLGLRLNDLNNNNFILANALIVKNGSFAWDSKVREKPILKNINLNIKRGQLVAIVGPVGSGKSSLIFALIGEMNKINGKVNTKVSYESEFITSYKVRKNISFKT